MLAKYLLFDLTRALLLSRCSNRSDEREDALLLGHQYVLRMWRTSYTLFEHSITRALFEALPEFDENGNPQLPYEEWALVYWQHHPKPHKQPVSDHDWLSFWPHTQQQDQDQQPDAGKLLTL